jgi:hypothetical protein
MDKINFIKAYNKAREAGLTTKNIQAAFRTTGNWPISRRKALSHPEIQQEAEHTTPERELDPKIEYDSEVTPKTSRDVRDYGKNKSPSTRRRYNTISKGYAKLEFELASKNDKIAALEAEVARLPKTRKRKAIPNPNKKFILLSKALASNKSIAENRRAIDDDGGEEDDEKDVIKDEIVVENEDEEEEFEAPMHRTKSGKLFKKKTLKTIVQVISYLLVQV